jgi:tRNA(adenine34) deaminase
VLKQLASSSEDPLWMQRGLEQAWAAVVAGEVPVGAVLVSRGRLLAEAHNQSRITGDPTAHAELLALRRGVEREGSALLLDATLYVTLEPCAMCAGALVLARVARLVYAASDPKAGMCGSLGNLVQDRRLNHRVAISAGVLARPAGELLRAFFRAKR